MICNYKKCRKPLNQIAWVTNCSHAFCEEHGLSEFANKPLDMLQCPACNTKLTGKFDVVQADLNPPEAFKSIVLAGIKPDIILDIAMRAISFWSYQTEEERKYQENIAKHTKEKVKALQEIHELSMQKVKVEFQNNKNKIEDLQNKFNCQKRQYEESVTALNERNRKIQKLQYELDNLKRNPIHIDEHHDKRQEWAKSVAHIITNKCNSTPNLINHNNNFKSPTNIFSPSFSKEFSPIKNKSNKNFIFNPVFPT